VVKLANQKETVAFSVLCLMRNNIKIRAVHMRHWFMSSLSRYHGGAGVDGYCSKRGENIAGMKVRKDPKG